MSCQLLSTSFFSLLRRGTETLGVYRYVGAGRERGLKTQISRVLCVGWRGGIQKKRTSGSWGLGLGSKREAEDTMWWRRRWRGLKNPDSQSMCAKTPEEYFHDFVSSCRLFTLQKSRNSVAMGVEGGTAEKFQTANLCVFPWRSGAKTPLGLYVCDWRLAENKCSVSLCFLLPRRVQSRKLCRTNTCLEGSKKGF